MDLRFKLVSSIYESPAVPIAAVSAPETNSSSVSVSPGDLEKFRKLNDETFEYNQNSIDVANPDYFKVPLKSFMPPQAEAYSSSIVDDILLGPINENMVWEVKDLAGNWIKSNNQYLSIVDLRTNQLMEAGVQYSSDGSTWGTDTALNYIRLLFSSESLIGAIPLVTFADITPSGTIMYHRLITPTARFTDFSISESIDARSKTKYSIRFHRDNYKTEFGLTSDTLTWQNDPISNIDIVIPRRRKTQAWTFQIRKATEVLGDIFVSTINLVGSRPAVTTAEVPHRITPGVLKLSQKDLNVISSGVVADLHDDWTVGIHLTINGKDKTNTILDVNEKEGYILLKQPVSRSSSILVDYAVDTDNWVEVNFDLNPRAERKTLRPGWMDFDVDDSDYSLYIQRNTVGPDFFIGPSARLNKIYPYPADIEDPKTAADYITKRPSHISLGSISVRSVKKVSIVDIRRPGGGLKDKYKTDTSYDLKSHTSLGFYDGLPIQENVVVLKLPTEIYRSIYDRHVVTDTNSRLDKTDTFVRGSTLSLSYSPHFNYTLYDWLKEKWDLSQITVDVTDSNGTSRAIDVTNYTNLIDVPTLTAFSSSAQYTYYYYRGKIYLNASSYILASVSYKYVVTESIDQNAHIAASNYINDAINSFIAAGTFFVVQDTDGNPYPAERESK